MTGRAPQTGPLAAAAIGALRLYKASLSPVFYFFGVRCRHAPTCSDYAMDAFRRHGAWAGFWLTFSRLSRCHPFGSHGWDPVPETRPRAGWRFWRLGDWAWTERPAYPPALRKESLKPPRSPSS